MAGWCGASPLPIPFPLLCGNITAPRANMVQFQGHPTTRGYINSCPVREVCVYLVVVHSNPLGIVPRLCLQPRRGVSFIRAVGGMFHCVLCFQFHLTSFKHAQCPGLKWFLLGYSYFFMGLYFVPEIFVLFFTLCYGAFCNLTLYQYY